MLEKAQLAPDFTGINQDGNTIRLADFKDKNNLVLYFYPKDDTPGCTIEANDFTALTSEYSQYDTVIIGVSKDDCASHKSFIAKFGLGIDLIADTDGTICESYQVWQEKEKNGVRKMGIVRSTFIIDKNGSLVEAMYQVKPEGHAQAVLDIVKTLT